MREEVKHLANNFSEVFKSIHQRSYHKMEDKCLYPGQPKLLILIKDNPGITQKDLSERNFVTPASITGMLNKLEASQYLYREADETDKRIMRVYLTPEGKTLAEQGEKFLKSMTEQIFLDFTDEELQILVTLTDKMKVNLRKI